MTPSSSFLKQKLAQIHFPAPQMSIFPVFVSCVLSQLTEFIQVSKLLVRREGISICEIWSWNNNENKDSCGSQWRLLL